MTDVLVLEKITKKFTKVIANKEISMNLHKGEVLALLGENGAGKTTLMNCVCGLYKPTSGKIYVNGAEVEIHGCENATKLGIGMIHQHFMLVPELSVAENVILGINRPKDFFLKIGEVENEVQRLSELYNFGIDPKALVKNLPIGMQQRVEIIKTLYRKAEIIILDEATAVLTPSEARELYGIVKKLAKEGKSIIVITHKLEEVMEMADRIIVLRDGKYIGSTLKKDTNVKELATMMVGREVLFNFKERTNSIGEVRMQVEGLTVFNKFAIKKLDNISFSLHAGEILGVAGVDGNGQLELSEALTGMMDFQKGKITINGKVKEKFSTMESYNNNVSHIPQDRQATGLIMERSIAENLVLSDYRKIPFSQKGLMQKKAVREHGKKMIDEYTIKAANEGVLVKELSGGNKQKVILAREIARRPDILIAVQPTRGLDIGATEFVRQKLLDERNRGVGVLLISTELEEILQISDRIAVIFKGEFMGILDKNCTDIGEIGMLMAGVKNAHHEGE